MRPYRAALLLLFLAVAFTGASSESSHRSILSPKRIQEFYASGGRRYIDKKVHIHLSSAILKKKSKRIRLPGGKIALLFENKSVPILINPCNNYYKRLRRKLKSKKKVAGLVCIKGYVFRPDWDVKGRCFLRVKKIKTYGGKLTDLSKSSKK